ncbi:hypothetical protein H1R20_g6711, partial [Candolleomyces eurysporus]
MPQADLSKVISEMWQNEPSDVREEFDRRAKEAKALHSAMYPNYRYQPQRKSKKPKERGSTRQGGSQASASTSQAGHGMTRQVIESPTPSLPSFEMELPDFSELARDTPVQVSQGYIGYQPTQATPYGPPAHYGYPGMFSQATLNQRGISVSYPGSHPSLTDSTNAPRSEAGPSAFLGSHQWTAGGFEVESTDEILRMQWWESLTDAEREEYLRQVGGQSVVPGNGRR